jgi:hypothetical protein
MDCMVCMDPVDASQVYVVQCGSSVDHTMCQTCADSWRSKMLLTAKGRKITCPSCRVPELVDRSKLVEVLAPRIRPEWCQSGRLQRGRCFTRNKTSRECSMAGCQRRVCRACVMCDSHSDF